MLNDVTSFKWGIPDMVRVDDYSIIAVHTSNAKYKPFERFYEDREFRLYIEFSKVESIKDIERFVSSHGVLGLEILDTADRLFLAERAIKSAASKMLELSNIDKSSITRDDIQKIINALATGYNPLIDYISSVDVENDSKKKLKSRSESVEEFLTEAKLMRYLLKLNSINFEEFQDLKSIEKLMQESAHLVEPKDQSTELYERGIDFEAQYEDFAGLSKSRLLEWKVKAFISSVISLQLEITCPALSNVFIEADKDYEFAMSYRPKNLFGAMYLMFALDLVGGNKTVLCPVCQQPLLIVDKRGKQCHKKCTGRLNTQLTRKRERQAKDLYKSGKTSTEIYQIINMDSEKEIKMEQIEKWVEKIKESENR